MTKANPETYQLARERVASGSWTVRPEQGIIIGSKGRALFRLNSWGYVQLKFRDAFDYRVEHAVLAHRVIWEYVNGPLASELTINHMNGVKTDNRIVNLEAVTMLENARHAHRTGLFPPCAGMASPVAKLDDVQVLAIYRRAWAGEDQSQIGADFGVGCGIVSNIKQGHAWSHLTRHRRTP